MEDKRKKKQEESIESGGSTIVDPLSPIERHVKWKMTRTKHFGNMTSVEAQQISDRIASLFSVLHATLYNNIYSLTNFSFCLLHDSLQDQMTQGNFVPHGCQDILATAIGQPEHSGRVCAVGLGVTIS